jgi:hypothetical protein
MTDLRDLLTRAEAKTALRIGQGDSSNDAILDAYITAASRALDQWAGHTVALTITSELHDGTNRSGRGFRHKIILRHRPVIAVTTVIEHRAGDPLTLAAETTTVQPTDAYLAERYDPDPALLNGHIRRRASGEDAWFEYGRQNIAVTYTAGRVQSTSQVDARFKHACRLTLENLWRDREPGLEAQGEFDVPRQSFPTFAIPNAVKHLLSEEIGQNKLFGIA